VVSLLGLIDGQHQGHDSGDSIRNLNYRDIRGRKTVMDDPDMGRWVYAYNGFGELVTQTDAKGQTVTMVYDKLGRMISRSEPEGASTWTYDTACPNSGDTRILGTVY